MVPNMIAFVFPNGLRGVEAAGYVINNKIPREQKITVLSKIGIYSKSVGPFFHINPKPTPLY